MCCIIAARTRVFEFLDREGKDKDNAATQRAQRRNEEFGSSTILPLILDLTKIGVEGIYRGRGYI
jgi:hypothetical protein